MFEAHVLHLLRKYLGEYVHDLSVEALKISVWNGDVVLKDLKLKAEALNSLKLPLTVKAGFVGSITLRVPWKSLGKEPVVVVIDRVFLLARPTCVGGILPEEDRERLFQAKLSGIEDAESATLEAVSKTKQGNPLGKSWLGSLVATVIGNLKISITTVHIRYEDFSSHPGNPFCVGLTLAKLAAVTTDEQGNETFDTSGVLDKLHKALQLERLALYHDSNRLPWKLDKKWEDLSPDEWVDIFEGGIREFENDHTRESVWALNRSYLVSPINGSLKYHRLGNQERPDPEVPFEKASLVLTDLSFTIAEAQYHDWIKLLEVISRYKRFIDVSHLRPVVSISKAPSSWWRYAAQAGLQQRKTCYKLSWDQIRRLCELRRRYIQLYASSLQCLSDIDYSELRVIEKDLDSKIILLWRLLAHAKVKSARSKGRFEKKQTKKRWFWFGWHAGSEDFCKDDDSKRSREERFTNEEWQAINSILSYHHDEELRSHFQKDAHNAILFLFNVSITQAAARIVDRNQIEIICGRFEHLDVSSKIKKHDTFFDVSLRYYGLSVPEGSIAESVCSKNKVNALAASFSYLPVGENVDWSLSAAISPCHVTILVQSYDRFLEFVKRSNAVSPVVVSETATSLQLKIGKASRRAQEQFKMVFEEQNRFALHVDLDAPKIRIPVRNHMSSNCESHFIFDFGHFTLYTKGSHLDEHPEPNMYSRFYIYGRDIAAFFTDCSSNGKNCTLFGENYDDTSVMNGPMDGDGFCSVVDKCGVGVVVDQIKVPHPAYPSTCISIQVPNLRIHFSPTRYYRIIELVDMAYRAVDDSIQHNLKNLQNDTFLCDPAGLATEARMLVWRGIGNSVASWHPCFIVLSGIHIYVLESQKSRGYQRRFSLAGKQVCEIPSADIGGSHFCLALGLRGKDIHEIVESCSALVIKFLNENDKSIWSRALIQASYQASTPPTVDVFGDPCDDLLDIDDHKIFNSRAADLVVNGALREARLLLYGKADNLVHGNLDEILILELFASGAKVNILYLDNDLTIKMKLHSLQIKDELLCSRSNTPKYLACSALRGEAFGGPSTGSDIHNELSSLVTEDEDIFTDALPDFTHLSDRAHQNVDVVQSMMEPDGLSCGEFFSPESIFPENDLIKKSRIPSELFYEVNGPEGSDFVSLNFSTRSASSPHYVGVDTEMTIHMSKLEFFCNRPTIVALMHFGWDISSRVSSTDVQNASEDTMLENEELKGEDKYLVKGLLGSGKSRIIFLLKLNFDSVTVFLNMEDDSQLAMFVQDCFRLNLKVHPSGISIDGALGNFRLSDTSLGESACWGWLCDIRNPGVDSIIKFAFNSYSIENDDYNGYDYSLHGCLSAVRIVFLYRFVQEVMTYFMELATPHSEEAIKLIDKVGDFEWWIKKYEIDGLPALKLDVSLVTPLIIFPRDSLSNDFVQLDIGKLIITNDISWYGGCKDDPSAVLLDLLHAEIHGVNMAVGVNNIVGESMIKECQGIDIFVQRSLRDIFRREPIFSFELKMGSLHGRLTNKEYHVILDCAYMNLYEEPRLPASFRSNVSGSKDAIRLLVDKVNTSSQNFLSRNVTIVAVVVDHALLELCSCIQKELLPLAHLSVENLWISYRMTSFSETDAYVTLRKFSIFDLRRDTRPEMRLMLGLSTDASMLSCGGNFPFSLGRNRFMKANSEFSTAVDVSYPTMFLMDFRSRTLSQSYVIRVQQPRVLVVLDFLIAVGEFFIPTLGTITGRKEATDPKNDPIFKSKFIVLSESYYKQKEEVVYLSPCRQLVVDSCGVDEYIYDGCGGTICLSVNADVKGSHRFHHVIFIGRGKRLRFVNVKFKNGSLLGKYTHLSNNSSYTVSSDDGVDMLLDHHSPHGNVRSIHNVDESPAVLTASCGQLVQSKSANFTFEAQVVCPEFIFYDSSESFVHNISYDEKFLCAKAGLLFMSAKKESDIWIRALVQNATVEAGSGLVVLDPTDVSLGYTSVKDKTNISLFSTDLCVRLSLGVISLALTFQNQVAAALRFGDVDPIIQCTNFEHIWCSSKGIGTCSNLTFWRPRAPPNYVVLGDCVTSRAAPPSQAVMAVSQMYGRVCQPLGFKLVGLLSEIQYLELDDTQYDCSLWMPVAPSGYSAVGCVAHVGSAPPLNQVAYCLRSDLLTSSSYSECICTFASSPSFSSGFSIWRSDNVVGSFFAHPSMECPPNGKTFELNYLLLLSSMGIRCPPSDPSTGYDYGNENGDSQIERSSQCDPLRPVPRGTSYYMSTPHFERIWWDKGTDVRRELSIWRPLHCSGYAVLGDCVTEGHEPPSLGVLFKADNHEIAAVPVQFTRVAHIAGKGIDDAFFWYPISPPGYASLGCLVTRTDEAPDLSLLCCPKLDLVISACIAEVPIALSLGLKTSTTWSIWKVENQACTFLVRSDLKKPSTRLGYKFGEYFESKAQKSIAAEFKLRLLSLTILDSLCGVVTPLVDTTITDIKFVAHGEIEKMNTVVVAALAASSFNTQLEAWEPLLEPFHGIFKFDIYGVGGSHSPSFCKRMRIAVTDVLNLNVSAANLDMFVQAINSWKGHLKVEGQTTNVNDQSVLRRNGEGLVFSALDEDNIRAVFVQNKLGCDLYLKKVEQMSETVELIGEGNCVSVWVPPPRFSARLNVASDTIEARYFAAVRIYEAQGLPLDDGGNGHDFFCALRLIIDGEVVDQQWSPQSARTRCVKPFNFKNDNQNKPIVRWNEIFVFEIPHKSSAKLEVEVTNLAAKAGKGEVVGEFSYSVGCAHNLLTKVASMKMPIQSCDPQNMSSYQLKRRREHVNDDGHGKMCVLVSTTYFQWKTSSRKGVGLKDNGETDVAFWVGLNPKDVKERVSSLLPLSVVPKNFCGNALAMEVKVRNGRKHAIFRSLATVTNDSDVSIDILIGHLSIVNNIFEASDLNIVVEEIFENQRYHPSSGWGCGIDANGAESWSSRDFTFSSEDFFEPPLEPGWRWTTAWSVDYSAFVDSEGWAHGCDFKTFFWPPMSLDSGVTSSVNVVRRRRWIRTRQRDNGTANYLNDILYLSPGSSAVLPWRSMFEDSDHCMFLRPHFDLPETQYCWSRVVTVGYGSDIASEQVLGDQASLLKESNWKHEKRKAATQWFQLNQLEEKDVLLRCLPRIENRQMWFTMAVDAAILHTELNTPVYDWKVSISSPLKLENRLPCTVEFTLWEKHLEGTIAGQHHGVACSRESVCIYSADIRKPVYMSTFIGGGWVLEKDPILIMDLLSKEHIRSFAVIQKQSKRRLFVSVDRDMGGTNAAPKVVRLFVPYWIVNDTFLPLVYHIVEIDSSENTGLDSPLVSRAVKSRSSIRNPTSVASRGCSFSRRNIKLLHVIEDTDTAVSMLSLHDYMSPTVSISPSRTRASISSNIGISVAIRHSETFSDAVSLLDLERKELTDIKTFTSPGSYYKLSLSMNMTSDRTKVIHIQPHTLFVNRIGHSICLQQSGKHSEEWIHPTDCPRPFCWQSLGNAELLRLRVDGFSWSEPFTVENEGLTSVHLKGDGACNSLWLRVEVRRGMKSSRYEVIFLLNLLSSPYRIENHTLSLPLHYRQVDSDLWHSLLPNSAVAFLWKDLGKPRLLELLPYGCDSSGSSKCKIDEVSDCPIFSDGPTGAIRVTVLKEEKVNIIKISDLYPDMEHPATNRPLQSLRFVSDVQQQPFVSCSEVHIILELSELGLSIIDHTPEEILYLSMENFVLFYSSGLASGVSRLELRVHQIQVDNQLPLTPMPVLFRPQRIGGETDSILKFTMTVQSNGSFDLSVYPYIGVHIPEGSALLINIHEPIIWRLYEMIQKVDIKDLYVTQTTEVPVDPIIHVGVLKISEVRFKLSMSMSPTQRPKGVLGFWSSLMTALGNTETMPVKINHKFRESIHLRRSVLFNSAISNIKKDLLSQPLQLLSGVDILGNASSALGHMSRGVAALSMDKKFIQGRQRQENKGVEDFGDVIREGGGALAKGLFRGVTGILTKPLEGAKASGVEGFVQGVGKGIIGAAAQPVSGVLDLLSRTTEGANAMRIKILSALTSEEQLLRKRLPRVIGGDNLLRPYDEYKAQGQVILQLAESASFFGQVDLFKVRGKFALSDAYEDHFLLPKGKILVITHRRVILLQQPMNTIGLRKFIPARDPCSILWDVSWDKLAAMELVLAEDRPTAYPSRLIIYLQTRSADIKERVRVVKCIEESDQACKVYSSISQTMSTYGPCHAQEVAGKFRSKKSMGKN